MYIDECLKIISEHATGDITNPPIDGITLFKATKTKVRVPSVYKPSICFIFQGSKNVFINRSKINYGVGDYLLASVDMPVIGVVTEASEKRPYYCLQVEIDTKELSQLIINDKQLPILSKPSALILGKMDNDLYESVFRLLKLLSRPDDAKALAPLVIKEIYYYLLKKDQANVLRHLLFEGSSLSKIAIAIKEIRENFKETINMDELAKKVGMSSSSFFSHFKSVTQMSPLQFQKQFQLTEARHLLLQEDKSVGDVAYMVGYESPSQFNREYSRFFGLPPKSDVTNLRRKK
jgi:AraC-like DNA-binding protein